MPCFCSIRPAGTCRAGSIVPTNITLLPLPPKCPELNPPRTSGSSCARTGSPIACSIPTRTSSTSAATPGTSSSTSPGGSCPSACGDWAHRVLISEDLVLASDMSESVCEHSLDCRQAFGQPIGQGAKRSWTDPWPRAGLSEGRFGRTLRLGAISNDSAGCRQRS